LAFRTLVIDCLTGDAGVIGLHLLGFYGVSVWRFGLDSGFSGW